MFEEEAWYQFLEDDMKVLVDQTYFLIDREEIAMQEMADYGFIVFEMAKAYEGFVKKYLYEIGFINKKEFEGDRFRIGRSLSPDVEKKFQDERWLYDDLASASRGCLPDGGDLARIMWTAWKEGRNRVFHYFEKEGRLITFDEAKEKIEQMRFVMQEAIACKSKINI